METEFHVLIAAAGSGARFGGEIPKQYQKLAGKSILRHTLEVFFKYPGLKSLKVIIDPSHENFYHEAVKGLNLSEPVFGSNTRKNSIFNGIKSFSNLKDKDIILIHDAARPCISPLEIKELLNNITVHGAATLATPITDTLRRPTNNEIVDRSGLWAIQTPQAFTYEIIRKAHEKADPTKTYTDDSSLVLDMGIPVRFVEGKRNNIKITTPDDLLFAETLLAAKSEIRTGSGFDVHAFAAKGSGPVRLCGVDIPYERRLEGHSDADVALHALTDAILGTVAEGDIGDHFPPSDMQWKGASSDLFLRHTVDKLVNKNGNLLNLDITLICEYPKIGPHRQIMRQKIADICDIDVSRVSIKATTTEGLGFTGRGEGIAAQAIVTVRITNDP